MKRGACADEAEGTCKCKIFRSSVGEFDWKQNRFICGRPKVVDVRTPDRNEKWRSVQTLGIKDSILDICRRRQDRLSFVVQGRLETTGDLPAAEAVYHVNCYREFSKVEKVQQESEPDSSGRFSGRPVSQDMMDNFYTVCDAMDDFECELYTIDELRERMVCISEDPEKVYSTKQIQRLLQKRYMVMICFLRMCVDVRMLSAFAIWQNV